MSDTDDNRVRRRLAARRFNERLKLIVISINTVGLTMFGAAFVLPLVTGSRPDLPVTWVLVAIG